MSTTSPAAAVVPSPAATASEAALPLDLVALELSLDGMGTTPETFSETVRVAARKLGGEFLFALPASGLAEDCRTIGAIRIPDRTKPEDGQKPWKVAFVMLAESDDTIRVEEANAATDGLQRFAEAFIDLLERMR